MKQEIDLLRFNNNDTYESFNLKDGSLDPVSFMGLRGKYYKKQFFFSHEIYDKIKTKIIDSNLVFIVGNPLAGKTRVVYDTLSNLDEGFIVKPKLGSSVREYSLPRREDLYVFFDELDDYCKTNGEALNNVLAYIIKNDIKCILTCRTGPEYDLVRKCLHPHIFTELHRSQVIIPRFDKDEPTLKNFLSENFDHIKNLDSFDGNMGALILPLDDMRTRFACLVEKKMELQIAILKGLKLHYHLYNYESKKSYYDDSKILQFCKEYLEDNILKTEWENAKRELTTDETTLNFIAENDFIIIEEAYLDFLKSDTGDPIDVIDSTFNKNKIDRVFNDIYKDIDKKHVWGFPTTIYDYNKAIEKTKTYNAALTIFEDIPQGIKPDQYTFSLLIKRTRNIDILKNVCSKMIVNNIWPNKFIDTALAGQLENITDFIDVFSKYDPTKLHSRNWASDRLIKLARKSPKESLKYFFGKYELGEIYKNPLYSEICYQCCDDDEDYIEYVQPFTERITELEEPLLKIFIRLCCKVNIPVGLSLLDGHCDNQTFFYFNQKGNCLRASNPLKALILYLKAEKVADTERNRMIARCNYCNLVYEQGFIANIAEAIQLSSLIVGNERNTNKVAKYLRRVFILLEIWNTPLENLIDRIEELLKRVDINKNTIKKLIKDINEPDKKNKIQKYIFPSDKDENLKN